MRGHTVTERFWAKVVQDGDCWLWSGQNFSQEGYGKFSISAGEVKYAHLWAWEHMVGSVPDGLELDHLCLNKACVNPAHLEPVTHDINMQRALFPKFGSSADACRNGHQRTPENRVKRSKPRPGVSGECKICNRERERARRERSIAERGAA